MNKILLLSAILLFSNVCSAQSSNKQSDYDGFVKSFRECIDYPVELFRTCTSTFCLMRVQVDTKKNVTRLTLSDSADSLLKKQFELRKKNINIQLLETYLIAEYKKEKCSDYLIPLSYSFHQMPCPKASIDIDLLYKYYRFDEKNIDGTAILLKPIMSIEHIQN